MPSPNSFLQSPFANLIDEQDQPKPLAGSQAVRDTPLPTIPSAPDDGEDTAPAATPAPVASTDSLLPPPDQRKLFEVTAAHFQVPVNVLMALAHQESGYNAGATNKDTGAAGPAQYLDATAKSLRIDPRDPNEAIPAAAMQIRQRLDKGYSMADAIKEHFAGPDKKKWGAKTAAYGDEVLVKAGQIGQALYGDESDSAPQDKGTIDLGSIDPSTDLSGAGSVSAAPQTDMAEVGKVVPAAKPAAQAAPAKGPAPSMTGTIGGNAIGGLLSTIVGAVAANAHLVGADDVAKDWAKGLEQIKGRQKELGGDTFAGKTASLVGGIVPAMVAAPESKVIEFATNSGLFGVPAFQDTYKQKLAEGQSNKLALVHAFEAFGMNTLMPTIMQKGTGALVGKLASEGAVGAKAAALGLGQAAGEGAAFSGINSIGDKLTDTIAGQQNDRPWIDPEDMAVQAAGFGAIRGAHMAPHVADAALNKVAPSFQVGRALAGDVADANFDPNTVQSVAASRLTPDAYDPNTITPQETARTAGDVGPSPMSRTVPPPSIAPQADSQGRTEPTMGEEPPAAPAAPPVGAPSVADQLRAIRPPQPDAPLSNAVESAVAPSAGPLSAALGDAAAAHAANPAPLPEQPAAAPPKPDLSTMSMDDLRARVRQIAQQTPLNSEHRKTLFKERQTVEKEIGARTKQEQEDANFIYRGQPEPYKDVQTVEQSDGIDNILIGKGIFTTSSKKVASTYGSNIFKFHRPDENRVLNLSNASEAQLRPLLPDRFFQKSRLGIPGDTWEGPSSFDAYRHMVEHGDTRGAEDMLTEALADKYLPGDVTWDQVRRGDALHLGVLPDQVRAKMSGDLQQAGYDFVKHKGGIRAGGEGEHTVYIALNDKALRSADGIQPVKGQGNGIDTAGLGRGTDGRGRSGKPADGVGSDQPGRRAGAGTGVVESGGQQQPASATERTDHDASHSAVADGAAHHEPALTTEAVTEPPQPAAETAPAPTKTAPVKTGGHRLREMVKAENPFLGFLAQHGIHIDERSDTGGQPGRAGMVMVPGYGSLYRKSGTRLDELAGLAHEAGFLSDQDMQDPTDNGGTRKLADLIQRAVHNKEVIRPVEHEPSTPHPDRELFDEAERLGIDTRGKSADEVYDAVSSHHAERFDDVEAHGAVEMAQDADIPLDGTPSHDLNDEELDAIFGKATRRDPGQDEGHSTGPAHAGSEETGATRTGESAASADGAKAGSGNADDSILSSYSADDVRARQDEQDARAREESSADARAERDAKAQQDRKDIASRQDASAEHFQLGQSTDDSLSGQHGLDMFDIKDREEGDRRTTARGTEDRRTIEVDGERRPIHDSQGRLLAGGDFGKQQAFWKWAGDTKVADEQGRPMVVYHGTNTDVAELKSKGELHPDLPWTRGIYFTADPAHASRYSEGEGANVMPVFLKMERPKIVTEEGFKTASISQEQIDQLRAEGYDGIINRADHEYIVFDGKQVKSATGNDGRYSPDDANIMHDITPLMRDNRAITRTPRVASDGRGAEHVASELRRARDAGEIDKATADFALWVLRKSPSLARDLGINVRDPNEMGAAGSYQSAHQIINLFRGNENPGTAVHEILHHTERMMPAAIQKAILKAWRDAYAKAYEAGDAKTRAALDDMRKMATDRDAARRVIAAFRDGTLKYGEHYQLSNPSEYWAVNATRIMGKRYAADTWQAKARNWISELMQKARGWLGLPSDAPVLKGLQAVLDGTGERLSPQMLVEQMGEHTPTLRDINAPRDEEPDAPAPVPESTRAKLARMIGRPVAQLHSAAHDIGSLFNPMAGGSEVAKAFAKDFANQGRKAQAQWNAFDNILRKNYTDEQLTAMWHAADQENDLRREGQTSDTRGLNSLPADQRETVEVLHQYGEQLWDRAKRAGLVSEDSEGVAYWTPRVAANIYADGSVDSIRQPAGEFSKDARNLRTSANSTKQRKHDTTEESEAALKAKLGDDASYVKNIRVMPMAMAQLEKAIAGRTLVNQIKAHGQVSGEELVSETGGPNFVTFDHPALKRWIPVTDWQAVDHDTLRERGYEVRADGVYRDGEKLATYRVNGDEVQKLAPMMDSTGKPVLRPAPLFVHKDFEGPLKAVFSKDYGNVEKVYRGMMAMKGAVTSVIMVSPLTHNLVIWGKALPTMTSTMGWKNNLKNLGSLGFRPYFVGNNARSNHSLMNELIDAGMVPVSGRGMNQDIEAIANGLKPGRSLTAKALGSVFDLASPKAGDAARKAVDKAGEIWHEKLLWDRVADMQAGMAVMMRSSLMDKGLDQYTASRIAAHFANRYAGMIPQEAMSKGTHMLLNLSLFSKSFTGTNVGAYKDLIGGLPGDVQAQIRQHAVNMRRALGDTEEAANKAGDKALGQVQRIARTKAAAVLMLDVAAMATATSIAQAMMQGQSWQQFSDDFKKRLSALGIKAKNDPLSILGHPLDAISSLSQTASNPHGKEDRVRVGEDEHGNSYYMRLPVGKVGEELKQYGDLTTGMTLLHNKLSTFLRPLIDLGTGKDVTGKRIILPHDNILKQAAAAGAYWVKSQLPVDDLMAVKNTITGGEGNGGTKIHTPGGDLTMDQAKTVGWGTGLSVSKLTGGDAVAEMRYQNAEQQAKLSDTLPDVKAAIQKGNQAGAIKLLQDAGQTPSEIAHTLRAIMMPNAVTNSRMKRFIQHASPEEVERMQGMMQKK